MARAARRANLNKRVNVTTCDTERVSHGHARGTFTTRMQNFRKLHVWAEAHALVLETFRATQSLARVRQGALCGQIRRAAMSVPANIAEGCGRQGTRELARFVEIALASATELEYHLLLARDLGLLPVSQHSSLEERTVRVKRMLTVFLKRLRMPDVER